MVLQWFADRPELVEQLRDLGRPESHLRGFSLDEQKTLFGLYALSRVIDVLIAPYQPAPVGTGDAAIRPWWSAPLPEPQAWLDVAKVLRATPIQEETFHPFFHEIVEVRPDPEPTAEPRLVHQHWPGMFVGHLLLVRAGVTVSAGSDHLVPDVAARSCLFWAWWRRYRPTFDLSHGWGGASQWGTEFRRDYFVDGQLYYNVDEAYRQRPRRGDGYDITDAERRDLLRFRHSVRRDLGDDQFPFRDSLVEPRFS
jgi:hypothetical protein